MRFHVVSLPHTNTDGNFPACAYTQKVINFCKMMVDLEHEVYLYSGDNNTAQCTEHIQCISINTPADYTSASFDYNKEPWTSFNSKVIEEIRNRIQPKDFICLITGYASKQISDAFPDNMAVEYGIGYGGSFSKYKVWESYAWMHLNYGTKTTDSHSVDGQWFDEVIPGYLDPDQFTYSDTKEDYYLFMGRQIERKGMVIIDELSKDKNIIVCGPPNHIAGSEERNKLMSKATAVIVPTIYIEPFGNVAIEAMACGTPVITTDWGAFTETVIQGVTGYRCRMLYDFKQAMEDVKKLDSKIIRQHVVDNYSLPIIGKKYEHYFNRLLTLYDKGWYAEGY